MRPVARPLSCLYVSHIMQAAITQDFEEKYSETGTISPQNCEISHDNY
jgi:hypothetical protein